MNEFVLPTREQTEWADCGIGVLIHYDLPVFCDGYHFRKHWNEPISPEVFNPSKLDTDEWIKAAADMGAKYAVLVAKHCTGFCLWPTNVHPYSVKSSPWKNGEGDIVADFIKSCKKFGLKPGLYYSAGCNRYYGVDNPGTVLSGDTDKQQEYNKAVLAQLSELWSNYGELFEIWFDGGCLPCEKGGPDIASLLHSLQPNAVVFQGPSNTKSLLRWIGNENGVAFEDCSSIVDSENITEQGCTHGDLWCPAESDLPNRYAKGSFSGGWFYSERENGLVVPAQELLDTYIKSVGRNTNMLIGMVIDTAGEFPNADAEEFRRFGELRRSIFGEPLVSLNATSECEITVKLPDNKKSRYVSIGEDISYGERIEDWSLQCDDRVITGKIIGHKRIIEVSASSFVFRVNRAKDEPKIKFFNVF